MSEIANEEMLLYIGTYTRRQTSVAGPSQGIYVYKMNMSTGALTPLSTASDAENPSFLALHPTKPYLYSVSEIEDLGGESTGGLSAFAIDPSTGALTLLNAVPSGGTGPCHVRVDGAGRYLFAANYGSGSAAMVSIQEDGSLGDGHFVQHDGSSVDPNRQTGPHAHSVNLGPSGNLLYVADLGMDQVVVYKPDWSSGRLVSYDAQPWVQTAPGAGPRHMDFHPSGKYAYVINEMNSTLTAYTHDADTGVLTELQTVSTLPEGYDGGNNSTADVHVHPNGRFIYGSNRGHNSIVIFAIDPDSGQLSLVDHESTQGEIPRNFTLDPGGDFLLAANQNTDNIVVFRVDSETGLLTDTGVEVQVPVPVCLKFYEG